MEIKALLSHTLEPVAVGNQRGNQGHASCKMFSFSSQMLWK